ncbi:hypothetical protein Q8V93_003467 [Enterobacter asburiae]|nr:hypothetical protein [Enterobacter asburiae]
MKTTDQASADDRMVLARALCSWPGSDRHAIEIPNHEQWEKALRPSSHLSAFARKQAMPGSCNRMRQATGQRALLMLQSHALLY